VLFEEDKTGVRVRPVRAKSPLAKYRRIGTGKKRSIAGRERCAGDDDLGRSQCDFQEEGNNAILGPRRILADFLIGAHASHRGYRLLTLDDHLYPSHCPASR
jgi:hypothetical protein